jgi:hypothetical protein
MLNAGADFTMKNVSFFTDVLGKKFKELFSWQP